MIQNYRGILDKFYEADNVATRGASGTAGASFQDYSIPSGEVWQVRELGGSASIDQTEVELLYTENSGTSWINPYDSSTTKIRCIHLQNGNVSIITSMVLQFTGGAGRMLRLRAKNFNALNTAEITSYFTGVIL